MTPFLVTYGAMALIGAVLATWTLLARVDLVPAPPELVRPASSLVWGAVLGITSAIFADLARASIVFLALLVGGTALLALHYRGDGRWLELAALLTGYGVSWVVLGAWAGPLLFGVGVVVTTLGLVALVIRRRVARSG